MSIPGLCLIILGVILLMPLIIYFTRSFSIWLKDAIRGELFDGDDPSYAIASLVATGLIVVGLFICGVTASQRLKERVQPQTTTNQLQEKN